MKRSDGSLASRIRNAEIAFSVEEEDRILGQALLAFRASASGTRVGVGESSIRPDSRGFLAALAERFFPGGLWAPRTIAFAGVLAVALGTLWFAWSGARTATPRRAFESAALGKELGSVEARAYELLEGSRVSLGARAEARVTRMEAHRVEVVQTAGFVEYSVSKRRERLFSVSCGRVRIEVRGTAFSVAQEGDEVLVQVTEGSVAVREGVGPERVLRAGERLVVREPQRPASTRPQEVSSPEATSERGEEAPTSSTAIERGRAAPTSDAPDPSALFEAAQLARAAGDLATAASSLRRFVSLFPADGRVTSAYFLLGRVERARGAHAQAAEAFLASARRAGSGTLGADATVEEVISRQAAGQSELARAAAARYLRVFPNGEARAKMSSLVE